MSEKDLAAQNAGANKIKVTISMVALFAGIVGYYHFASSGGETKDLLFAFGSLGVGVALFLLFFWLSQTGKNLIVFFKEARRELSRVVWPTRDETKKMTLMVMVVMGIVLLYLLLADSILAFIVRKLLGWFGGMA